MTNLGSGFAVSVLGAIMFVSAMALLLMGKESQPAEEPPEELEYLEACEPCSEKIAVIVGDGSYSNPIFVRSPREGLIVMLPFHPSGEEGIALDGKMLPWGLCDNKEYDMKLKFICVVSEKNLSTLGEFVFDYLEGFEWTGK